MASTPRIVVLANTATSAVDHFALGVLDELCKQH